MMKATKGPVHLGMGTLAPDTDMCTPNSTSFWTISHACLTPTCAVRCTLPSSLRVLYRVHPIGCFLDADWMLIGCWLGARHPTLCPIHACLPGKNERRDKKPAGKNGAGKKGGKKKFSKKGGKGR